MTCVDAMHATFSARSGIRALNMGMRQALEVIQGLTAKNFYKSMTTHKDHTVWQDVYYAEWNGIPLYVKFCRHEEYFLISFKERDIDGW